jgi:hypothetical protein
MSKTIGWYLRDAALPENTYHDADINKDMSISQAELTNAYDLYNASMYGPGTFYRNPAVPGGFSASEGCNAGPLYNGDYVDNDWKLRFAEILRITALSNAGAYELSTTSVDGFAAVGYPEAPKTKMTRTVASSYQEDERLEVTVKIEYAPGQTGTILALGVHEFTNNGNWKFVDIDSSNCDGPCPDVIPPSGFGSEFQFIWSTPPTLPITFKYYIDAHGSAETVNISGYSSSAGGGNDSVDSNWVTSTITFDPAMASLCSWPQP